jgi:glycosyltransferase involved in cell wall biosynthesis
MKTVGVVCPVFQEEEVITLFHERLTKVLKTLGDRYVFQILYVVDPAPDRTEEILAALSTADATVGVLVMSRRFGHQVALLAGVDHCDADAVITLDTDLQHPPEVIPQLLSRFEEGFDVVQTLRGDSSGRSWFERVTSVWFYSLLARSSAIDLEPGAADYRLLSRRVADIFRRQIREQNQFLRGMVRWVGFRVAYVTFECESRARGRSKYGVVRLLNFAIQGIFSFSKIPLRLATFVGAAAALLGFVYGVFVLVTYFLGPPIVPGWTSLLALISLLGGVQLIFMGVIGEYIGLIFDEVKSRPLYLIDRAYGHAACRPGARIG